MVIALKSPKEVNNLFRELLFVCRNATHGMASELLFFSKQQRKRKKGEQKNIFCLIRKENQSWLTHI